MKGQINPKLKVGDKVICYHMDGETGVPPGTKGVVISISKDPFESEGELIYSMEWENGSTLSLLSSQDAWKKLNQLDEQVDKNWKFIIENSDIYEHFDWRWFREYLKTIRDSGIINMFGAGPLLYSGKKHIDRYYGEGREDDERFQAVLDDAEESKNKIVQGVLSYMEANNKDIDDLSVINGYASQFSRKLVSLYITLSNMTGKV
jgi:hypothetical protein